MNDAMIGLGQYEELPTYEVSDEMLETTAGMEQGKPKAYTLSFCSGLSTCPA